MSVCTIKSRPAPVPASHLSAMSKSRHARNSLYRSPSHFGHRATDSPRLKQTVAVCFAVYVFHSTCRLTMISPCSNHAPTLFATLAASPCECHAAVWTRQAFFILMTSAANRLWVSCGCVHGLNVEVLSHNSNMPQPNGSFRAFGFRRSERGRSPHVPSFPARQSMACPRRAVAGSRIQPLDWIRSWAYALSFLSTHQEPVCVVQHYGHTSTS